MARQLVLLRHGTAEDKGGRPDPERDLVVRGEQQARDAGRALARLGHVPDVVLASPKVRAWRTAELACEALDRTPAEHGDVVGLDRDEALALSELGERVLVVGHDPDLSQVVGDLTGARVSLAKGGLAIVSVGSGAPSLHLLLRPRAIGAIAG